MKGLVAVLVVLCLIAVAIGAWVALDHDATALPTPLSIWSADDPELGRRAYAMCQGCHGLDGHGVPGYAPALAASQWLTSDARGAILITLHGYDATSEPGAAYHSSHMLGHGRQLADHEIAGLLSWARMQWGNAAPAIGRAEVSGLRAGHASRQQPWSPAELRVLLGTP